MNDSRESLVKKISQVFEKIWKKDPLTTNEEYFLLQIEHEVEKQVIAKIQERQAMIPGLKISNHGYKVFWGDRLTPGCEICLEEEKIGAIRSVSRCNLNCKFCYYYGEEAEDLPDEFYRVENNLYTLDDMKLLLDKQSPYLSGIAWVYYEPFIAFEKHPELVKYIADKSVYQWMYTNGTLCTEDHFKILSDIGLTELRFNLAATLCSKKVLKNMAIARKYFDYLVIESPMYKEYFESFMKHKDEILETGVDHINCAELHLDTNNLSNFSNESFYKYKREYVSPVSSRHYTYDLIEMAEREDWDGITINDCSNQLKFYRGILKPEGTESLGKNCWFSEKILYMAKTWYLNVLDSYDIGQ